MNGITLSDLYNRCTINNKNTHSCFGAILKELKTFAGSIQSNTSKRVGASRLKASNYEIQTGTVEATFYVKGDTEEACSLNVSNLVLECQDCIIKTADTNFEYACILTGVTSEDTGIDFYKQVTLQFNAIKRLPLVVVPLDHETLSTTVHNRGNVPSGLVLKITAISEMDAIKVCGITVTNLSAGDVFIIDGLEGTVKCNGINRFLDTDLIDFPKIQPGNNLIEIQEGECNLVVSFYPTFSI